MSIFYSRLSYSFGNEDWTTERQALKVKPADRVLCITASGDRPLNLLYDECQEIVCIDANKIQNHLLNLKNVAMRELPYDDYLAFLGVTSSHHRGALFKKFAAALDPDVRQFWENNHALILDGVLYQGAVEKLVRRASKVIALCRRAKLKKLFEMDDLFEQQDFVKEEWDSPIWKNSVQTIINSVFLKAWIRDPGVCHNKDAPVRLGNYIYDRMNATLHRHLAKESVLISLILRGSVAPEAFSPYLTKEGTEVIKSRLDRISMVNENVINYLETCPEASFDCFSLSDVASYISKEDFVRMMKGIHRAAKPGARFSVRQFSSFHEVPICLKPSFVRDHALEKHLEKEDSCFVYRYMVGNIAK